jgi:glycosyltransferase involved in cell wall biosynthesis
MRVALALEHYAPHVGGAERLFEDLAGALTARQVQVRVVTSDSGGVSGVTREGEIEVHHHAWRSLFAHPVARRVAIEPHIAWADVVLTSQYTAAPAAVALARKLGKPCVFVAYEYLGRRWEMVEPPLRAQAFRAFERWVYAQAYDRFVAISQATARDLIAGGIEAASISTIYPVFNDFADWRTQPTEPLNGQARSFLYYGRAGRTKGVFLMLDAIRQLHGALDSAWQFELILSDDLPQEKRAAAKFVATHGLQGRVAIEDSLPPRELRKRVADAYCVIVPSLTEGFGFCAYEACCMGKNLIVSDAGSLPEVVSGSHLMFRSGSRDALAAAIVAATEGRFETQADRIARDGANRMLALCDSLLR